jgi:tetratricopeptide (TPR) repeat protein
MESLRTQLDQLENTQLVRRLSDEELTYLFKHTLTQESAYESLLQKTRRELHRRVGESYEKFYPDRLDEYAALLAHHYDAANDDEKTLVYATRAGDAAARLYANQEAKAFFARAIEVGKRGGATGEQLTHLYASLGRVLELSGHYEQALQNYEQMQALAKERGDRVMELAALISLGTLRSLSTPVHNPEQAHFLSDESLGLARELSDRPAEARILWNLMLLSKFTGHTRQAVEYGEQSLKIAREYDPSTGSGQRLREQLAFTLNDLALHGYKESGQFDLAQATMEEARQLWRELKNLPMLADSLSGSAIIYATRGEYDQALAAADEARGIGESIGNLWGQSYSRWVVGDIHWEHGDIGRAIETMEACMRLGDQAGFVATLVGIQSNLAMLYGEMGSVARGIEYARRALDKAEQELEGWMRWPLSALVRLFLWQGNLDEAEAMLDRAADTSSEGYFAINVLSAVATGELALAKRDFPLAVSAADSELARQYRMGARVYRSDLLKIKANALFKQNDFSSWKDTLEQGRVEAEAIGSRRMLWQILAPLSEIEKELGNATEAEALRARAREIAEYIAGQTPSELRDTFLLRPEVRALVQGSGGLRP